MTTNLFQIALSVICNGIEIVMFFLLVRMVLLFKSIQWLKAFDDSGRILVDGVAGFVDRSVYRVWKRHLTIKSQLVLAFVLLELCRAVLIQTCQCI
jgi:hypothetical protein